MSCALASVARERVFYYLCVSSLLSLSVYIYVYILIVIRMIYSVSEIPKYSFMTVEPDKDLFSSTFFERSSSSARGCVLGIPESLKRPDSVGTFIVAASFVSSSEIGRAHV